MHVYSRGEGNDDHSCQIKPGNSDIVLLFKLYFSCLYSNVNTVKGRLRFKIDNILHD